MAAAAHRHVEENRYICASFFI